MKKCKATNCNNKIRYQCGKYSGYCDKHYMQIWKYGKILKRTRFDKNEFIDCGDYFEICLYSGRSEQKEIARAKIDKDDLGKVKDYKWSLFINGYIRNVKNRFFLHQFILGKKQGYEIDHINHDPADNRKQNLRHCTNSQNNFNRKSKGYWWHRKNKKWIVEIVMNKQKIYLGCFKNEQDAITARRDAEQKYFKKFAFNYDV